MSTSEVCRTPEDLARVVMPEAGRKKSEESVFRNPDAAKRHLLSERKSVAASFYLTISPQQQRAPEKPDDRDAEVKWAASEMYKIHQLLQRLTKGPPTIVRPSSDVQDFLSVRSELLQRTLALRDSGHSLYRKESLQGIGARLFAFKDRKLLSSNKLRVHGIVHAHRALAFMKTCRVDWMGVTKKLGDRTAQQRSVANHWPINQMPSQPVVRDVINLHIHLQRLGEAALFRMVYAVARRWRGLGDSLVLSKLQYPAYHFLFLNFVPTSRKLTRVSPQDDATRFFPGELLPHADIADRINAILYQGERDSLHELATFMTLLMYGVESQLASLQAAAPRRCAGALAGFVRKAQAFLACKFVHPRAFDVLTDDRCCHALRKLKEIDDLFRGSRFVGRATRVFDLPRSPEFDDKLGCAAIHARLAFAFGVLADDLLAWERARVQSVPAFVRDHRKLSFWPTKL